MSRSRLHTVCSVCARPLGEHGAETICFVRIYTLPEIHYYMAQLEAEIDAKRMMQARLRRHADNLECRGLTIDGRARKPAKRRKPRRKK